MKKIILNEQLEKKFLEYMICENEKFPIDPIKVLLIKKFLDKNFKKGVMNQMGENGFPSTTITFGMKDNANNIIKDLTPQQLFDVLEDNFVNMFSNKLQRSKLLAQVIKDWCDGKITSDGLLSVNTI